MPVIVTDQVGLHTDIKEYNAGIIVHSGDIKELSNAILEIYKNQLVSIFGLNARKLAENKYSTKKMIVSLVSLYKSVVDI